MAIENIKSDLKSLIKLYRHLQSLKIGSQHAGSEYLDEKAQIFLKDLLDGASEKFMAARLEVSEAASKTLVFSSKNSNPKPAKRRRRYKLHPKIRMQQFKSRDAKRNIHKKDPKSHRQQRSESSPYQRTESNQQNLILHDSIHVNNTQTYDDSADISGNQVVKKAGSSIDREVERKNEVADSISNHVASTIKIIDSHILALESTVDPVITDPCVANKSGIDDTKSKPLNESVCDITRVLEYGRMNNKFVGNEMVERPTETNSPGSNMGQIELFGQTTSINLTNKLDEDKVETPELKEALKLDCEKEDQVGSKSVKAMVQRIESMSRLSSQNDQNKTHSCRYIRGMRVLVTPSPNKSENEFQDIYSSPQNELNSGKSRSSMPNRAHHRFMVPPILYGNELDQGKLKAKRNKKMSSRNKISLEDTSSSSVASSNWTRQKRSSSNSDIDDYSQTDTRSNEYVDSSSYPDSDNSFFKSGDSNAVISESTEKNSVEGDEDEDSESISVGSIMNRGSNSIKVKKPKGGFKKLKDKIGLIFHHHHHHHHHHHEGAPRGKSLWKNAGKILRGKGRSRTKKYAGKSVENDARSLVSKNQNRHFHDIVKGVWKHVKNSRSSKVSKGDRKRDHGGKKGAQKMQWWRMLQQQRAAKKMPRKPKVKVGVGTTKPRLRALPLLTSEDGEG